MSYQEINRLENKVTDAALPDPEVLPEIPSWHILCRPVAITTKTAGGIILTSTTQDKYEYIQNVARVVKIGDLAYKHEKFINGPYCKVGDYVVFGRQSADMRFDYKGVSLVLLKDDSVRMTIDAPESMSEFSGFFSGMDYED